MTQFHTFQEALEKADTKRHLLIGNGFSIDWRDDIFRYEALFDLADFSPLSVAANNLFDSLETRDFEFVIEALKKASLLTELYKTSDPSLAEKLLNDAKNLKDILAKTIAKNHPDEPSQITKKEYTLCRQFLSNFNSFYYLNYDLLLYWVLMHEEAGEIIKCDDGFRNSDDTEADYVIWENANSSNQKQNMNYLHGALHLFDAGIELQKFTWTKTGIKLIDQVRSALDMGLFPLIVTEGASREKLTRINHSGYLSRARRSFANIGGSLFIHGHSLADNDDHIIRMIPETKVNKLFISLMSKPDSDDNVEKLLKIQSMIEQRKEMIKNVKRGNKKLTRQELEVYFYDARTAHVWR